MQTRFNVRRFAGTLALTATVAVGTLAAACTPTVPTAKLANGVVTVTGTAARDLVSIRVDADRLRVDFGADGTVEFDFARSDVTQAQVLAGEGNDDVFVAGAGVGSIPITASGGGGDDTLDAVTDLRRPVEGEAPVTLNGDDGNDGIRAAVPGPVTVQAGAGDDVVEGGGAFAGREVVSLGAGNDLFIGALDAQLGIRNDVVDGGNGRDVLEMDGTTASETLRLSASSGHLIGDLLIGISPRARVDADNVEDVQWFGVGGPSGGTGDSIVVNDLSATDVFTFRPDFSSGHGTSRPNSSVDTLTVRGTDGDDAFQVGGTTATDIVVAGLAGSILPNLLQPEDALRIETLAGNDLVDSASLVPGLVRFSVL